MDKGDYIRSMQYEYYLVNSIPDFPIAKQKEVIEEALESKGLKIKRQSRIFTIDGCLSDSRHLGQKNTTLIVARSSFIGRNIKEIAYVIGMCRDKKNCVVVALDCMELGTATMCNNLRIHLEKEIREELEEIVEDLKKNHESELEKLRKENAKMRKKLTKLGIPLDNMHNLHKKKNVSGVSTSDTSSL